MSHNLANTLATEIVSLILSAAIEGTPSAVDRSAIHSADQVSPRWRAVVRGNAHIWSSMDIRYPQAFRDCGFYANMDVHSLRLHGSGAHLPQPPLSPELCPFLRFGATLQHLLLHEIRVEDLLRIPDDSFPVLQQLALYDIVRDPVDHGSGVGGGSGQNEGGGGSEEALRDEREEGYTSDEREEEGGDGSEEALRDEREEGYRSDEMEEVYLSDGMEEGEESGAHVDGTKDQKRIDAFKNSPIKYLCIRGPIWASANHNIISHFHLEDSSISWYSSFQTLVTLSVKHYDSALDPPPTVRKLIMADLDLIPLRMNHHPVLSTVDSLSLTNVINYVPFVTDCSNVMNLCLYNVDQLDSQHLWVISAHTVHLKVLQIDHNKLAFALPCIARRRWWNLERLVVGIRADASEESLVLPFCLFLKQIKRLRTSTGLQIGLSGNIHWSIPIFLADVAYTTHPSSYFIQEYCGWEGVHHPGTTT